MIERDKVIKVYEDFVNGYECFCTSDDYEYEMHKAVLAMLKEDCHNCKLECLLQKYDECINDALELLKEQEDLETELTNAMELIHKKNERIRKLEEQIETLTRWRANAGAFD